MSRNSEILLAIKVGVGLLTRTVLFLRMLSRSFNSLGGGTKLLCSAPQAGRCMKCGRIRGLEDKNQVWTGAALCFFPQVRHGVSAVYRWSGVDRGVVRQWQPAKAKRRFLAPGKSTVVAAKKQ